MEQVHPQFPKGLDSAPDAVCSRWMGDTPCGAIATHHVIWDYGMRNSCVCAAHVAEVRQNWAYIGLHPYDPACTNPNTED